jgi:hypothetical protein
VFCNEVLVCDESVPGFADGLESQERDDRKPYENLYHQVFRQFVGHHQHRVSVLLG